jgi:hypothetical protein
MVFFHSYVAVYQRVRSKFQRFALNDKEEEQVTAVNRQSHLRQHVAETQD